MKFEEAKEQFIQSWGALATQWGINKTMAQIHSLLMISDEALSMEDIMERLQISRGNASMNLRELINWGIVFKETKVGERREFFVAEQDIAEMARRISIERSKREIKPILRVLNDVTRIDEKGKDVEFFQLKMEELHDTISLADQLIEKVTSERGNWVTKTVMKLFR